MSRPAGRLYQSCWKNSRPGENAITATLQACTVLRHIRGLASRLTSTADDRQLLERFTERRDEPAFAELVRRHGPLVLGVCRRVLRHHQDAEDAFQATFLVLAQKAAAISRRESVGGWLYQVAYHTAPRARGSAAARQRRERRADGRTCADPLDEVTGRELLAAPDEELARLPWRQRSPLVLCYLGGKTRDEAARELGCSLGTLKRRLDAGRERLRQRLGRRGMMLPAVLLGTGVAAAAVPPALAGATARAAAGWAAVLSVQVARLVRDSLRALAAGRLKAVGAALLAAALIGAGLLGYGATDPPPSSGHKAAAPAAAEGPRSTGDAKPAEKARDETNYSGRVLDPDGKPVAGAKVNLVGYDARDQAPPKVRAETDKDGRFSFTAPPGEGQLFVTAPGRGPAGVRKPGRLEDNPLKLARDDVPISGRVLDLEGRPVAGATVRVHALKAPAGDSLDPFLEAIKVRRDGWYAEYDNLPMFVTGALAPFFPPVTTDRDGRFRFKGVGRERAAALIIEGPTIETREVNVLTRPGAADVRVSTFGDLSDELLVYHPPTFAHAAGPCRVAAVRDKATGRPVAGAIVWASDPIGNPAWFIQATADREGRFRLTGLPRKRRKLRENELLAVPPAGEPYLAVKKALPARQDAEAALDFELPRGVWLEGQVRYRPPAAAWPPGWTTACLATMPRRGLCTCRTSPGWP